MLQTQKVKHFATLKNVIECTNHAIIQVHSCENVLVFETCIQFKLTTSLLCIVKIVVVVVVHPVNTIQCKMKGKEKLRGQEIMDTRNKLKQSNKLQSENARMLKQKHHQNNNKNKQNKQNGINSVMNTNIVFSIPVKTMKCI